MFEIKFSTSGYLRRIERRIEEWLFPGINVQVERYGRITRTRVFLGGLIEFECSVEEGDRDS